MRRIRVLVHAGVSRRDVLEQIRARIGEDAAVVSLPPLDDADAPLHGLLQAAACVDRQAVELAMDDRADLHDRARSVASSLAKLGRVLVVWVPPGRRTQAAAEEPDAQLRRQRVQSALGGWIAADLPIVLLMSRSSLSLWSSASRRATAAWA
ncbi:MAG: hypothetical protein IT372_41100 [Polyangiaceae bacterium]|nr:hypothetical protein [Polyangiaceae bacterium]